MPLQRLRTIAALAVAMVAAGGWGGAATSQPLTMRISTENGPTHFQTRAIDAFAEGVARLAGGRIDVRHVAEARLFGDRDVVRALQAGQLEMAVPGIWQLDRAVPDAGLFLLPLFYGRDAGSLQRAADGAPGRSVSERIEQQIQVKVLGRWLDLGFTHVFSRGKPIRGYADLVGRRIRVAGGEANRARLEVLGAQAFVIPWVDFPEAFALGNVDGALTTFETVASARLWEKGLGSAFADRQYFAQYVPLVSRHFWERLPDDLQDVVAAAWEEQVESGRRAAAAAQAAARDAFVANGGDVVEPAPADRARVRETLLTRQDGLVTALGIDPELVILTRQFLEDVR